MEIGATFALLRVNKFVSVSASFMPSDVKMKLTLRQFLERESKSDLKGKHVVSSCRFLSYFYFPFFKRCF